MIGAIVINHSKNKVELKKGDKIAQLVVAPVTLSRIIEVEDLDTTARGEGGFGSTDKLNEKTLDKPV